MSQNLLQLCSQFFPNFLSQNPCIQLCNSHANPVGQKIPDESRTRCGKIPGPRYATSWPTCRPSLPGPNSTQTCLALTSAFHFLMPAKRPLCPHTAWCKQGPNLCQRSLALWTTLCMWAHQWNGPPQAYPCGFSPLPSNPATNAHASVFRLSTIGSTMVICFPQPMDKALQPIPLSNSCTPSGLPSPGAVPHHSSMMVITLRPSAAISAVAFSMSSWNSAGGT